jgi:fumarate reductase flavoprotein subunit
MRAALSWVPQPSSAASPVKNSQIAPQLRNKGETNMKKMILAAAVFALAASMSASFAADKTLKERHGPAWPQSENGYVTKNQCMKCHGDYAALGEKTAKLDPNPHKSHLGAVNCEDCHKVNAAKPELMCNECHQFTIREKAPAK